MRKQYSANQGLAIFFNAKNYHPFLSFLDYFYNTNDRKKNQKCLIP